MTRSHLIPVNIITGFLGTGKTTAIRELLRQRPKNERWAVLINEFGRIGIDGMTIDDSIENKDKTIFPVTVMEIAGGCMCCATQVQMRVTLTQLLRKIRPDRLIIEPSGLGHPSGIIDVLRDEWLSKSIELRATICLVDPRQYLDPLTAGKDIFQDQIMLADVLVANKIDLSDPTQICQFVSDADRLFPPKILVKQTCWGKLDLKWLDLDPRPGRTIGSHPVHLPDTSFDWEFDFAPLAPGESARFTHQHGQYKSCGWIFSPETIFDPFKMQNFIAMLVQSDSINSQRILRAKGVFRTGRDWQLVNCSEGCVDIKPIGYRRDSRVEFIVEGNLNVDWNEIESALLLTLKQIN